MCGLSVKCGFLASADATAGGNVLVVDSPVPRAATNTSSCIVLDYMPGFHSPDGQAKVNMKSLEQSLARYLSSKRYAIDFKETKLQKVSYTGL